MKRYFTCFLMLVAFSCTVALADPYTLENGVLTFDVDEADYPESAPFDYSESFDGVASTLTAIVKKGTGSVTLGTDTATSAFVGTITVEDGFLMGWVSRFGTPSAVTVEDGGAVEFTETTRPNTSGFPATTQFTIAGSGPDGCGAIQRPNAGSSEMSAFIRNLVLSADAAINAGSRWGTSSGTVDMNGHKLTVKCYSKTKANNVWSCVFDLQRYDTYIKNPGEVFIEDGGLGFNSNGKLLDAPDSSGSVSNLIVTVNTGATVRLFYSNGLVDLPCKIRALGRSSLQLYDENTGNTSSQKYARIPSLYVELTNSVTLYTDNAAHSNADLHVLGPVYGPGVLKRACRGHTYLEGTNTSVFGGIEYTSLAELVLKDDVTVSVTNAYPSWLGARSTPSTPTMLSIRDRARIVRHSANTAARLEIGGTVNVNDYAVMRMYDDAVISNCVHVGTTGRGAFYQFGGNFTMFPNSNVNRCGYNSSSYGYMGLDGGEFRQNCWFCLGWRAPGFFVQRGGTSTFNYLGSDHPIRIGGHSNMGYGQLAILGGTSTFKAGKIVMNLNNYPPDSKYSTGVLTVSGTNSVLDMSKAAIMVHSATNAAAPVYSFVNLCDGGTLKVVRMMRRQMTGSGSPAWANMREFVDAATMAYMNFNGGVLVTAKDGEFWSNDSSTVDEVHCFKRVTVYEKGATIDTDGHNVTWRAPLLKPYGYGIKSITLPSDALAKNALIGPSRCVIKSSAGGAGAEALMDFDDTNMVARGMIVTSPGFGYEAAPTVYQAEAHTGLSDTGSGMWTCTVETTDYDAADFVHGGLTKRGSGTLTVTCTNNYGGVTRLEGGTLAFTNENGLPGGDVEFAASALVAADGSTPLLTAVRYTGGALRVTEADTLDSDTWRGVKKVATFTEPLSALPDVEFVNADGSAAKADAWTFNLADGNTAITFSYARGTILILR